jgi:hypothetical protein
MDLMPQRPSCNRFSMWEQYSIKIGTMSTRDPLARNTLRTVSKLLITTAVILFFKLDGRDFFCVSFAQDAATQFRAYLPDARTLHDSISYPARVYHKRALAIRNSAPIRHAVVFNTPKSSALKWNRKRFPITSAVYLPGTIPDVGF